MNGPLDQDQAPLFQSYQEDHVLEPGNILFASVGKSETTQLSERHPPAVLIIQLWQTYVDNVNPLLKLTHSPTLQKQVIAASANTRDLSRPLECLLFNIYLIAIVSMSQAEVQNVLGETRSQALRRYHITAQQSLMNADFMRTTSVQVVQGYVLYLVSLSRCSIIRR